jgi:hypothetical protein
MKEKEFFCQVCKEDIEDPGKHKITDCWEIINKKYPEKFPTKEEFMRIYTLLREE